MLDYLQLYPETIKQLKRYNKEQRCNLYEAMAEYAFTGQEPDWPDDAPEWFIWETLKQQVNRTEKKVVKNRANATANSQPEPIEAKPSESKPIRAKRSQQEPNEAKQSETDNHDYESDKEINKDNDNNAHAGMPFGLTDDEIQASLERDQQIEDTAKGAGLNTSEISMVTARRYADEYGLEKLLDAIRKTALNAAKPSWAYVEGVLKGKGKQNDNRGNNSSVQGSGGEKPSKYAFLFDDAV